MAVPAWLTTLLMAAAGAAASKSGEDIVESVEKFLMLSTGPWKGTAAQEKKIKEAATGRQVLGASNTLKRSIYAHSPVLEYIKTRCVQKGAVYVVHVPSCHGKTTACFATMDKYATATAGLAFSAPDLQSAYYIQMMNLLELDYQNPPSGWMQRLLDALEVSRTGKHSYLLLDDFMANGSNALDLALLLTMKTAIRGKNVIAVVLTANEDAANMMLSYNNFQGIQPLAESQLIDELRKVYHPIIRGTAVPFDWGKYVSMEWGTDALKVATLADPAFANKSQSEKGALEDKIGQYLDGLDHNDRKMVNPYSIFRHLFSNSPSLKTETKSPKEGDDSTGWGCGAFCGF